MTEIIYRYVARSAVLENYPNRSGHVSANDRMILVLISLESENSVMKREKNLDYRGPTKLYKSENANDTGVSPLITFWKIIKEFSF